MSSNGEHETQSDVFTGIAAITVAGFKSIVNEQTIEVRPLTILAGVNSSGKSSFIQALLLLKQSLDLPVDAGPLLLNGANAMFKKFSELLSKTDAGMDSESFQVGIETTPDLFAIHDRVSLVYSRDMQHGVFIKKCCYGLDDELSENQEKRELIYREGSLDSASFSLAFELYPDVQRECKFFAKVMRHRCFLDRAIEVQTKAGRFLRIVPKNQPLVFAKAIQGILHLPGLRGTPEREYSRLSCGPEFPGTFESYTASVIADWQSIHSSKLTSVECDLSHLGLTSRIHASPLDDTRVELRVGRLPHSTKDDLINISDVGLGVSQVLPVIVACHVAKTGQMVYIEQPEIHLHPKAQFQLAKILVDAANRGVRVVVETHSSLLLLGIQAAVAEGKLESSKVKLNWFERNQETGETMITSREFDDAGRFGDWPVDFDDVSLRAQAEYLDAAEATLARK